MLKLPQKHTNDEKANRIIAQYLNENILGLVKGEIVDFEEGRKKKPAKMIRLFVKQSAYFFRNITLLKKEGKSFSACMRF